MHAVSRRHGLPVILIVLVALVAASLACGPAGAQPATPTEPPTSEPPTVVPPTPTEEGKVSGTTVPVEGKGGIDKGNEALLSSMLGGSQVTVTLVNDTSQTVCYVLISPTTSDAWGEDWLGPTEVIEPGGQRDFSVETGAWDALAADCDGNEIASEFGVYVEEDITWTLSSSLGGPVAGGSAPVLLENTSSYEICWVYISPTTSDVWGADWLGADTIPAGTSYTFYADQGDWDLHAASCDGETLDMQFGIPIDAEGITWTIGDASGGSSGGSSGGDMALLNIINRTGVDMCYLYISPTTSDTWGEDWLGSDIIAAGTSYTVSVVPGDYDMTIQDCSGAEIGTQMGVTIADDMEWEFTEDGQSSSGGSSGGSSGSGYGSLTVINNLGGEGGNICYLYISPSDSSDWGNDQLGADTIPTGTSYTISDIPTGTYDILAQNCNDIVVGEEYGVYIDGDRTWELIGAQQGAGADEGLTIINDSSATICTVLIGEPNSEWWGNILNQQLPPGGQVTVYVEPGTWALQAESCGVSGEIIAYEPAYTVQSGSVWHIRQEVGGASTSAGSSCGDGFCEAGEGYDWCPEDCNAPAVPSGCGDGYCDASEDYYSSNFCPYDCGWCGDGYCTDPEWVNGTCAADCD
jgi:hypothetical protein